MKRMAMAVMFVAVAAIATAAFAWDMPTKVPTSTDDLKNVATSSALQNTLNEKLKNANCKFTPGTTKVTGCDLKKLGTELGAAYKVAAQQNYRVEINIAAADATAAAGKGKKDSNAKVAATGYDRANTARDELKKGGGALVDSWNWNTNADQSLGDKLSLSVKVSK